MDSASLKSGRRALAAVAGLTALASVGIWTLPFSESGAARIEAKADPDSAGKFLHLLDYVAGDYHEAVSGGAILDQGEYDEQVEFVGKAGHAPDQLRGRDLFAANCAQCHGPSGHGDGPAGRSLIPRPADFHDRKRMGGKTPLQAFNSVRFGIEGTAMTPFSGMSRKDVWDLAYYVLSLGSGPEASKNGIN